MIEWMSHSVRLVLAIYWRGQARRAGKQSENSIRLVWQVQSTFALPFKPPGTLPERRSERPRRMESCKANLIKNCAKLCHRLFFSFGRQNVRHYGSRTSYMIANSSFSLLRFPAGLYKVKILKIIGGKIRVSLWHFHFVSLRKISDSVQVREIFEGTELKVSPS